MTIVLESEWHWTSTSEAIQLASRGNLSERYCNKQPLFHDIDESGIGKETII